MVNKYWADCYMVFVNNTYIVISWGQKQSPRSVHGRRFDCLCGGDDVEYFCPGPMNDRLVDSTTSHVMLHVCFISNTSCFRIIEHIQCL